MRYRRDRGDPYRAVNGSAPGPRAGRRRTESRYAGAMAFSSAVILFAHPDDGEFMCGGTVAKWARDGCAVHYVVLSLIHI